MNFFIDYNPIALAFNWLAGHSKLFTNAAEYFAGLFVKQAPAPAEKFLTAMGVSSITYFLLNKLYTMYKLYEWAPKHFQNRKQLSKSYLKDKYGDCYVVVTGCT